MLAAVVGFPALYLTGRIDLLWKLSLWAARSGIPSRWNPRARGGPRAAGGRTRVSVHVQSRLEPRPAGHYADCSAGALRSSPSRNSSRFRSSGAPCAPAALSRSIAPTGARRWRVLATRCVCCNRDWECWCFPRERGHPMASCCRSRKGPSIWPWRRAFRWCRSRSWAAMRRGRREALALQPGEIVVHFHAPIDPRQFATQRRTAGCGSRRHPQRIARAVPRFRLRANHPLR